LSKLSKELFEFPSLGGRREVLDVEVASLLRVLELGLLFLLLLLSVCLLQGLSDVELTTKDVLAIELLDSLVGCSDAVVSVNIGSIWVFVANEGERSLDFLAWDLHGLYKETLDVSVLSKDVLQFFLSPGFGEVLDVDVVGELGLCFSLILWVVVQCDQVLVL
jgi:hypothetical protein